MYKKLIQELELPPTPKIGEIIFYSSLILGEVR
jgi:hypothetical protein